MKKILMMMAIAACAASAQAMLHYKMKTAYDGGTLSASDQSYYALYAHSLSDCERFGITTSGTDAEIMASVESYFATAAKSWDTWLTAKDAWQDPKTEEKKSSVGGHKFTYSKQETIGESSYLDWKRESGAIRNNSIMVVFYEKGNEVGYRVAISADKTSAASEGNQSVVEGYGAGKTATFGSTWGEWYTVPIPEPTSGMLMLLGIAGLALRRKRA